MTFQRTGALVAAIALALLGTLGLTAYVHGAKDRAVAGEKLVDVYVASAKITAGTPADQLHSKVKLEQVPAKVRATDAVTNLADLKGEVASIDIAAGEQLLASRFVAAELAVGAGAEQHRGAAGLLPEHGLARPRPGPRRPGARRQPRRGRRARHQDRTRARTPPRRSRRSSPATCSSRPCRSTATAGQGADQKQQQVTTAPTGKFLVTLAAHPARPRERRHRGQRRQRSGSRRTRGRNERSPRRQSVGAVRCTRSRAHSAIS